MPFRRAPGRPVRRFSGSYPLEERDAREAVAVHEMHERLAVVLHDAALLEDEARWNIDRGVQLEIRLFLHFADGPAGNDLVDFDGLARPLLRIEDAR